MATLTDTKIRNAKPREKQYKLYDEKGLYLIVRPNGGKWWRFRYRIHGKENLVSVGTYPDVSLADAREARDEKRKLVKAGIDPALHKRTAGAETFEAVAREWHKRHKAKWSANHTDWIITRLEKDVFPWMGSYPIADITAPILLTVLRRIEARGAIETAHKTKQQCGAVFRYAVATGRCERDPSADLRGALQSFRPEHHPTITNPKQIGRLLRAIDDYEGQYITRCALRLAPLVFVRPGELRHAEWPEIDLDAAEWKIPAGKMKMGRVHIVPLSRQAVDILRDSEALTGAGRYVFPGVRTRERPMSENTLNGALRRLGYSKHEMTAHGFRSMELARHLAERFDEYYGRIPNKIVAACVILKYPEIDPPPNEDTVRDWRGVK